MASLSASASDADTSPSGFFGGQWPDIIFGTPDVQNIFPDEVPKKPPSHNFQILAPEIKISAPKFKYFVLKSQNVALSSNITAKFKLNIFLYH